METEFLKKLELATKELIDEAQLLSETLDKITEPIRIADETLKRSRLPSLDFEFLVKKENQHEWFLTWEDKKITLVAKVRNDNNTLEVVGKKHLISAKLKEKIEFAPYLNNFIHSLTQHIKNILGSYGN